MRTPIALRPSIPPLVLAAALAAGGHAWAARPGTDAGAFPPGETYVAPTDRSPSQVSRAYVRDVRTEAGRAAVDLATLGRSRLIVWTLPVGAGPGRGLTSSLRAPSGAGLGAAESRSPEGRIRRRRMDLPDAAMAQEFGNTEAIEVEGAEAGLFRLEIESAAPGAIVVAAEPESTLTLTSSVAPLSRAPGQPVTLRAELRDGAEPMTGARVSARLAGPGRRAGRAVPLHDDGRHGDGAADDGVYGVAVRPVEAHGFWQVRFDAEGVDGRGAAFARTSSGGFVSERGSARLVPGSVTAALLGRGAEAVLRVEAAAEVEADGDYRMDVIVAGPAAADGTRRALAWAEATQRLGRGSARPSVEVPLAHVGAGGGGVLLDVRLLSLSPIGVAGRTTLEVDLR